MLILPTETQDADYASGIIPLFSNFQKRGNTLLDKVTKSQITLATHYCKDLTGCGVFDYNHTGASISLNYLDGCLPRLNGSLSLKGNFLNSVTREQLADMLELLYVANGANFLVGAATVCEGVNPPI